MAKLITRIRDRFAGLKPSGFISYDEWQKIENRFVVAKNFLSDTNPIYNFLKSQLQEMEAQILENRIRDVEEVRKVTDYITYIFHTPKKVQDDEIIGKIKLLRGLFSELELWIKYKEEREKMEQEGKLVIDRDGKLEERRTKRTR